VQRHAQHPELTLGQIYSALAYYWDHQEELDRAISARHKELELLKQQTKPSRVAERLRRIAATLQINVHSRRKQ
jgi:hypothetical protein